jgi:chromate transporter
MKELAWLFLRLGLTAFGGPAAHVAMMEAEVVRRRKWMSPERFLDLLGAANLIPGPSSTELAIFIGYERAGVRGLFLAGTCFIAPAAIMVGLLAWAYVKYGTLPQIAGALYGMKPVVVAIVVQAILGLAPRALKKSPLLGALFACAIGAAAFDVDALLVLAATGAASAVLRTPPKPPDAPGTPKASDDTTKHAVALAATPSFFKVLLAFAKIGALVFGSGYVLLAFLRADLVERLHWIDDKQLMDAIAVGQVTPGPVFTTATFIGYLVAGTPGAVAATVGIFLPGFALVAAARPLLARVRRSRVAGAFLDGVNVASVALMVVVTARIAKESIMDGPTIAIAAIACVLLLRFKVSATWPLAGGAALGALARHFLTR